jgi:hypothetical protein
MCSGVKMISHKVRNKSYTQERGAQKFRNKFSEMYMDVAKKDKSQMEDNDALRTLTGKCMTPRASDLISSDRRLHRLGLGPVPTPT